MTRHTTNTRRARLAATLAALGLVTVVGAVACDSGGATPAGQIPSEGRPLHAPANFDPPLAGFVACSSEILEGDVVRVVDGRQGRMLATLTVDHLVKPPTGPSQVRLNLVDIAKEGVYQRWPAGTHLRLVVDGDPSVLPSWQLPGSEFDKLEQARPKAARLTCPYGPS
ncbi:MAG: hypothetical protein M3O94_08545 [Actinomycetota bacterium]|jgi:hypothetical protein|nr:hypothetical protein [Actinomycetota bacterium]